MRLATAPDPRIDTSFMRRGSCRGRTDLFFPPNGAPGAEARAVCGECPVLGACAAYADAAGAEGFWAGRWRHGRPA